MEVSVQDAPSEAAGVNPLRNPYKALDAFTEADAPDFFGRDELIAALRQRLDDFPPFLAVIGASGSGKSSVVMAGLIPHLRADHPDWLILPPVKPGAHPVEVLAIALQKAYFPQSSVSAVREDLDAADTRGLLVRAEGIARPAKARIVLLVDQFEEVFTQTVSEVEREQFINLLTTAAADPTSTITVILTLRADFFDRILGNSELGRLIKEHGEPVLPMSITDLKQTIERPAASAGLTLRRRSGGRSGVRDPRSGRRAAATAIYAGAVISATRWTRLTRALIRRSAGCAERWRDAPKRPIRRSMPRGRSLGARTVSAADRARRERAGHHSPPRWTE